MKVLSVFFVSFFIILKVFAIDNEELYAVPDKTLSAVLHTDTALNNEPVGDTLFCEDINKYFLFTCENPTEGQCLVYKDAESVKNSYFDKCKTTIIIIHGWTGDYENPLNQNITKAVLSSKHGCYYNIIRLDWSKYAKNEYLLASAAVRKVGEYLCNFLKWLTTLGLLFSKTILIGHSLGAHVSGFASRICDCGMSRIIGLDPARPKWENHPEKLSCRDAYYVYIIHSSKFLGDLSLIGHADFYVNGGTQEEICGVDIFCAHNMAPRVWCASWYYPEAFVADKCASMEDMEQDKCYDKQVQLGGCNMSYKPEGIFRLDTEIPCYPFMVVSENQC